jgi:hypothetical protein
VSPMLRTLLGHFTEIYRRALPSFITFSHDSKLLENNKFIIFDTLSIASNSKEGYLQETGVLSWGQIGRQVLMAPFHDAG